MTCWRRVAGQARARDIDRPSAGLPRKVHMHRKRAPANHRCDRIGAAKFGYLSCLKNRLGAVTEICRCCVKWSMHAAIPSLEACTDSSIEVVCLLLLS